MLNNVDFSCILIEFYIFGVLIIPKWLITVPGHIPILFGSFLELQQNSPNLDPYTPYLSPETLQKILHELHNIFTKYYFAYLNTLEPKNVPNKLKRRGSTNPQESSNEILKILDMKPISIKKHECMFAIMVAVSTQNIKWQVWIFRCCNLGINIL